jgi:hypothetical protein
VQAYAPPAIVVYSFLNGCIDCIVCLFGDSWDEMSVYLSVYLLQIHIPLDDIQVMASIMQSSSTATSIPNSNFTSHGFSFEPLVENRSVGFAVDYWNLKFDADKKTSLLKELKEELKHSKTSIRRLTDVNTEIKKNDDKKAIEISKLQSKLIELADELRKEKQNYNIQSKTLSKCKARIDLLETEMNKCLEDKQDADLHV